MSRRTSEASKAVAVAWSNEQQLVSEGKGTRDWTQEQQQDILDNGKAYDKNGKAFEGHHMKSAERYSEYQGDPENIQFLTRQEHYEAHSGNFQNSTNGYYDPATKLTRDFGLNKCEPCEVIELSAPVANSKVQEGVESGDESAANNENNVNEGLVAPKDIDDSSPQINMSRPESKMPIAPMPKAPIKNESGGGFKRLISQVVGFYTRHKNVIDPIVGVAAAIGGTVVLSAAVNGGNDSNGGSSRNGNSSSDDGGEYTPIIDRESDYGLAADDASSSESSEPTKRSSPREHSVSGYPRQQNGKTVHVKSYNRGKNEDD